jgi:hypothetical protein
MRTMAIRRGTLASLTVVVALGVAGCASNKPPHSAGPGNGHTIPPTAAASPATQAPAQPGKPSPTAGPVGNLAGVPWDEVGPGWALAEYTTGSETVAAPVTLFVIDPAGHLYPVYQWPATKAPWLLKGWSGDGTRALFEVLGADQTTMHELTLRTGRVTTFALPAGSEAWGYTRPDGKNILVWDGGIARYDLTGTLQRQLVSGGLLDAISSPDGATAVVSGSYGVTLVSNAGGVIRQLPIPGASPSVPCEPARWLNATTVVATCGMATSESGRVWAVPVSGAAPTALTPVRDRTGPDLYDLDAWPLPGGAYVDAVGTGGGFIGRQNASGAVTVISVPGMAQSQYIVAMAAGKLLVEGFGGTDVSPVRPTSLAWFDPQTGEAKMVLAAPANGTGVAGLAPFNRDGEQPAWN